MTLKNIILTLIALSLSMQVSSQGGESEFNPGLSTLFQPNGNQGLRLSGGFEAFPFGLPGNIGLSAFDGTERITFVGEFSANVPLISLVYDIAPQNTNYFMRFLNQASAGSATWEIGVFNGDFGNDLSFRYDSSPTVAVLTANGIWQNSSDRRFKENIQPINSALESLLRVRATKYNRKNTGLEEYGFIAQEIEKIYPELVNKIPHEDGEEYYVMGYTQMIPILTKGIQEQQAIIKSQSELINDLLERVEALENRK